VVERSLIHPLQDEVTQACQSLLLAPACLTPPLILCQSSTCVVTALSCALLHCPADSSEALLSAYQQQPEVTCQALVMR
jgi:hypothetical protein